MFHIKEIENGNVTKVVRETLVDRQMYVDKTPRKNSTNLVTSGAVNKVRDDLIDDNDSMEVGEILITKDAYDTHELGKFYVNRDYIAVCTEHTKSGDSEPYTYTTILTKVNGIVPALNELVDRINELESRVTALED